MYPTTCELPPTCFLSYKTPHCTPLTPLTHCLGSMTFSTASCCTLATDKSTLLTPIQIKQCCKIVQSSPVVQVTKVGQNWVNVAYQICKGVGIVEAGVAGGSNDVCQIVGRKAEVRNVLKAAIQVLYMHPVILQPCSKDAESVSPFSLLEIGTSC